MKAVILLTVNVFTPITLPLAMTVMPAPQGTSARAALVNQVRRLSVPTAISVPMKAVILHQGASISTIPQPVTMAMPVLETIPVPTALASPVIRLSATMATSVLMIPATLLTVSASTQMMTQISAMMVYIVLKLTPVKMVCVSEVVIPVRMMKTSAMV
jgi:hypothetical protein